MMVKLLSPLNVIMVPGSVGEVQQLLCCIDSDETVDIMMGAVRIVSDEETQVWDSSGNGGTAVLL